MASVAVDAGPDGLRAALQETTALGVHLEDVALRSGLDSIVTWRLEPEGLGTRMLMEHSGFDLTSPLQQVAHRGMGSGWRSSVIAAMLTVLAQEDPAILAAGRACEAEQRGGSPPPRRQVRGALS